MALDLNKLKAAVDGYHEADADEQASYRSAIQQTMGQLKKELPALCESDLAAVAFYIATMLASFRNAALRDVSEVLLDSAVGYSLGAAQMLGMLP